MSNTKGYVNSEYLDAMSKQLNHIKRRSYELMQIKPGHRVLDLGCGPGSDTIPLAALVGESGQVVGGDYDAAMVAEAEKRAEQAGVNNLVTHQQVDATALPFNSDYFDACRSERMFQHLQNPAQALSEMIRVTKPGGLIVIADTDWGSMSIATEETEIGRRLAFFQAESFVNNGYSGRNLYRLFKQQDLADISFEAISIIITNNEAARHAGQLERIEQQALDAGIITQDEHVRWRASGERLCAEGGYFATVNVITLTGRKR